MSDKRDGPGRRSRRGSRRKGGWAFFAVGAGVIGVFGLLAAWVGWHGYVAPPQPASGVSSTVAPTSAGSPVATGTRPLVTPVPSPAVVAAPELLKIMPPVPPVKEQWDEALKKSDADLEKNPSDARAHVVRGNVYAHQQLWKQAQAEYDAALRIDPSSLDAKANHAEVDFLQKNYAAARPVFASLASDSEHGDYFKFMVFLCDLLGGQEDAAARELAAFNAAGTGASYYFGNAAWDISHHQVEEARGFLTSADHIYLPRKLTLYEGLLDKIGYLPLPEKEPGLEKSTPPGTPLP